MQRAFPKKKTIISTKSGAMIWPRNISASSCWTDLEILCRTKYDSVMLIGQFLLNNIVQVVAPVRETVSQTLASLLLHMPRRSISHTHGILLQLIKQDFPDQSRNGNLSPLLTQ